MKLPKFTDGISSTAQEAVPVSLRQRIYALLRDYRQYEVQDENGDGYPLVDALTIDGHGIDMGEREIENIADMLAGELAHPPQPSETVTEEALCSEILAELTRARTKFPGKNVTFAALVEEVGELATATFEESADRVRKEAVQVAVMAMRMILDGDDCYEPWRAEKGLDPLDPALRAPKGNV